MLLGLQQQPPEYVNIEKMVMVDRMLCRFTSPPLLHVPPINTNITGPFMDEEGVVQVTQQQ